MHLENILIIIIKVYLSVLLKVDEILLLLRFFFIDLKVELLLVFRVNDLTISTICL